MKKYASLFGLAIFAYSLNLLSMQDDIFDLGKFEHRFTESNIILKNDYIKEFQKLKETGGLDDSTNHTPKKNRTKDFALETPAKKRIIDKIKFFTDSNEEFEFEPIYSKDSAFHEGKWAFIDPVMTECIVGVNGDDPIWDKLAETFFEIYDVKNVTQEEFIGAIVKFVLNFVKENENSIGSYIFFKKDSGGLVCRHYATFVLPFIARILRKDIFPNEGSVYQLVSCELNSQYEDVTRHAWNIIKFKSKNEDVFWVVDFYNSCFCDVSPKFLKNMKSCSIENKNDNVVMLKKDLTVKDFLYQYILTTKSRYGINMGNKVNVYNNKKKHELLSNKRLIQYDSDFKNARTRLTFDD